jgi:5'-nucleotidase / UDP-sugar diphosphatase
MDQKKSSSVTILHTNDIHGRTRSFNVRRGSSTSQTGDKGQTWDEYEREGRVGGFPALATAIKRFRDMRGSENVLLVDGGDTFSDDLLGNLTEGEAVIRLMKALGYQLMALGNHDFDYGIERTKELEKIGGFPMRGANVIEKATGEPFSGNPTAVLEAAGLRVGFLTLGYHNSGKTGSKKNLQALEFIDGVKAARRFLPGLRERSDVVVVLSHMGTAMDRLLAQEMPELDLIIGAHSHDRISMERHGKTLIVQAVADASVLGELILHVKDGNLEGIENRLHTLWNDEFEDDPEITQLLEEIQAPFRGELEEVFGEVVDPVGRNYRSESPFDKLVGGFLCQELDTEIAFLPGVGYGITLLPGPLTREALYTLVPHPAKIVTMELTGKQVLEILEQSAENQDPGDARKIVGGLVQTAGLRWTVDYRQPIGKRVKDVLVRGSRIAAEQKYRVATNSGMYNGLHNYDTFSKGSNIYEHEQRVNELVESVVRKQGVVSSPPMGDIILIEKGQPETNG